MHHPKLERTQEERVYQGLSRVCCLEAQAEQVLDDEKFAKLNTCPNETAVHSVATALQRQETLVPTDRAHLAELDETAKGAERMRWPTRTWLSEPRIRRMSDWRKLRNFEWYSKGRRNALCWQTCRSHVCTQLSKPLLRAFLLTPTPRVSHCTLGCSCRRPFGDAGGGNAYPSGCRCEQRC